MRWYLLILLFPCLLLLAVPCQASTAGEGQSLYEDLIEVDELEQAARKSGAETDYGVGLDEGLNALLESGLTEAEGVVKRALKSGVKLIVIVMLCGLGETVETAGGHKLSALSLAGTLAVASIAVTDLNTMLGIGKQAIGNMTDFSNVLFPSVAVISAATGAVTGAAVRQMATALFSDLLVNLINGVLTPLLYGYLATGIAYAAVGNAGLKRVSALMKWVVTTVLTSVMLAFVGYLSISGVVAGSADAAAVKTAKFAISGTIPVVGGILSDAAETILVSAGVLRGTVGVFGAVTILGICLLPLLRLAVHYLMYKLVAAISAAVSTGRVAGLIDQIGSAFGLMLGMTAACCLLLLVALVASVTVVNL